MIYRFPVGRLSCAAELAAVLFTHLHQDHARGATWSGELTFPAATALLPSTARGHG